MRREQVAPGELTQPDPRVGPHLATCCLGSVFDYWFLYVGFGSLRISRVVVEAFGVPAKQQVTALEITSSRMSRLLDVIDAG